MPAFDPLVAEYRYFVADFLSNTVIAELPFKSVSYERAIKAAGSFSGSIPVIDKTVAFNLYENTLPGKTALYVVRNNQCVWGGIIWSRSYSVVRRELSVNAAEFTSYLYHRNIWKTYSHNFSATVSVPSTGVANVSLDLGQFSFAAGVPIRIEFKEIGDWAYNGEYSVLASPAPTTTTFQIGIPGIPVGTYIEATVMVRVDTYDYVRQLLDEMLVDFSSISFPNDEIEPAIKASYPVTTKALSSNVATLTMSGGHSIVPGQTIDVVNVDSTFNGTYEVTNVTPTTVQYSRTASNVSPTATSTVTRAVTTKQMSSGVAYITTSAPHGFSPGDVIVVSGVDDPSSNENVFDGTFVVQNVSLGTIFTYNVPGALDVAPTSYGGTASKIPAVFGGTYGPFPGNSDFGLDYSTTEYSGVTVRSIDKIRRGFEMKTIGEELDEYSDTLDGFEYRIDCDYDPTTSSFTRTFVLLPINYPDPPPPGQPSPITRFGAQNLVFEYPGNISDVTLDESAEDAATRFFVIGDLGDLGTDVSQPYAAASSYDLLTEGWPLLDQEETLNEISDEDELYSYAERYLYEFQPPVADFKVQVNGSLSPVVGSYYPGDWCCLIINDDFIKYRLESALEPRSDLLLRKIESFSVSVPDNPAFPEQVSLNLITEWEVDKIGE